MEAGSRPDSGGSHLERLSPLSTAWFCSGPPARRSGCAGMPGLPMWARECGRPRHCWRGRSERPGSRSRPGPSDHCATARTVEVLRSSCCERSLGWVQAVGLLLGACDTKIRILDARQCLPQVDEHGDQVPGDQAGPSASAGRVARRVRADRGGIRASSPLRARVVTAYGSGLRRGCRLAPGASARHRPCRAAEASRRARGLAAPRRISARRSRRRGGGVRRREHRGP